MNHQNPLTQKQFDSVCDGSVEKINFDGFQHACERTLGVTGNLEYDTALICMGIADETGEVIDYMKKVIWHKKPFDTMKLVEEMGDLLFYLSALASLYEIPLELCALANIEKLAKRYPKGFQPATEIRE